MAFSGQSIYDGLNILLKRKRNPKNVFIEMNVVFRPENKDYAASLFSPILFYSANTFRSLRADKQPIAILGAIMNRKLIGPMLRGNAVSTQPNRELFNKMLKISSLLFSASVTYTIPFVAILWGLIDGEKLGYLQLSGFLIVLSGIYLVNRKA